MTHAVRDPIALFRFALRERDWRLAALLAGVLGRDATTRRRLEHELRGPAAVAAGAPRSLGALGAIGGLVRILAPEPGRR